MLQLMGWQFVSCICSSQEVLEIRDIFSFVKAAVVINCCFGVSCIVSVMSSIVFVIDTGIDPAQHTQFLKLVTMESLITDMVFSVIFSLFQVSSFQYLKYISHIMVIYSH
ncbi:hypothetical protein S83_030428 [Arachis hypogaea]